MRSRLLLTKVHPFQFLHLWARWQTIIFASITLSGTMSCRAQLTALIHAQFATTSSVPFGHSQVALKQHALASSLFSLFFLHLVYLRNNRNYFHHLSDREKMYGESHEKVSCSQDSSHKYDSMEVVIIFCKYEQ